LLVIITIICYLNFTEPRRDYKILNLDESIDDLSKRIEIVDSLNGDGNYTNHWRGKEIIPLND
jgi:hypothetical protein